MTPRFYDTYDTSCDASYDACFPVTMLVVTLMTLLAHTHTYARTRIRCIYLCVICVISVIDRYKAMIFKTNLCDACYDGSLKLMLKCQGGVYDWF
jgi:hypothetical protein